MRFQEFVTEALHFVRPGELRGSYSDQQMMAMGFRRSQNGSWYIDQRRWDRLTQSGQLREFAPDSSGGAQSYYTSTENFVNGYRQQKQEEIQELTDDGWSADEINDFKQGAATDIYRFQQVAKGFLKGLKPGFDMYLQMDTLLKDSLGCHWIGDGLDLNADWSKIYGSAWGNDDAC